MSSTAINLQHHWETKHFNLTVLVLPQSNSSNVIKLIKPIKSVISQSFWYTKQNRIACVTSKSVLMGWVGQVNVCAVPLRHGRWQYSLGTFKARRGGGALGQRKR